MCNIKLFVGTLHINNSYCIRSTLSNTSDIVRFFNNRSIDSLSLRAAKLGLKKITETHILTNEEYEFIKVHYPVYGVEFCHDNLPYLSKEYIACVAHDISFVKNTYEWTAADDAVFKKYYLTMPHNEFNQRFFPGVKYNAIIRRASILGLKPPKIINKDIQISEEDKKIMDDNAILYIYNGCSGIKPLLSNPNILNRAITHYYLSHGIRKDNTKVNNIIYEYADKGYSATKIAELLKQHNIYRTSSGVSTILVKRKKKGEA